MSTGIGDILREAREEQGRTLQDAAQAVRARVGQLQALEEERFDSFGGEVYAKGFLKSYALELGLDPEPLMATFRREVGEQREGAAVATMVKPVKTPGPRATTPPAWLAWMMVAVVVVAGLFFLGMITGSQTPDRATEEAIVGTPPSPPAQTEEDEPSEEGTETDTEEPPEAPPVEESEPPVEEEPEFEGVEVVLALETASWLRVTQDGAVILEETVAAGETLRYQGDEIIVRFGNAGGVRTQYNGEDLGAAGGNGQVVELRFTPDGVEPT